MTVDNASINFMHLSELACGVPFQLAPYSSPFVKVDVDSFDTPLKRHRLDLFCMSLERCQLTNFPEDPMVIPRPDLVVTRKAD